MRLVLAALAALALVACHPHGPALPTLPSQGGPAWIELQSEHFTLWTDSSRSRAQQLIRQMEHLRQVVLGVGFAGAAAEGRSLVLALRDGDEVGVFVPPQFIAYAFSGGAFREPVIILPADVDDEQAHVVTHELTHVISYHVIRSQPRWFAEGLANMFATVNLDPDSATGDFGKPLDYLIARLRSAPPLPAARMFACTEPACMDDMFYATAWAMVAFLANAHPQELLQYASRLDELPPGSEALAWQQVFPTLTADVLDHDLRQWLAYGKHTVWTFNVKLREWPVTERTLRDGDVLAARALMRQMFAHDGDPPPPELAGALAAEPTHLLANLVRVAYKQPLSTDDARRIAAAHPDDWRAWWLVGHSVDWHGEDARQAWEKACALLAKQPSQAISPTWCVKP